MIYTSHEVYGSQVRPGARWVRPVDLPRLYITVECTALEPTIAFTAVVAFDGVELYRTKDHVGTPSDATGGWEAAEADAQTWLRAAVVRALRGDS